MIHYGKKFPFIIIFLKQLSAPYVNSFFFWILVRNCSKGNSYHDKFFLKANHLNLLLFSTEFMGFSSIYMISFFDYRVHSSIRIQEQRILDDILNESKYDNRIRPSGLVVKDEGQKNESDGEYYDEKISHCGLMMSKMINPHHISLFENI